VPMKFMFANCRVCHRDVFDEKELVSFQNLRPLHLERVNLEGQQPWTSMLCICLQCVSAIQATEVKDG